MSTFVLLIIYIAFISLGLPDSLLGVSWPLMHIEYEAPVWAAGFISMVLSAGTIISSFVSGRVLKKFGTGKVTFISSFMTAVSLLGFSFAPSFFWLIFLSIPLGFGAGAVDSGLNNYVALHYKAHHMSWLHAFWGIGATLGPIIMSYNIGLNHNWRNGYLTVSLIQSGLVVLLFVTLPFWDKIKHVAYLRENINESPKNKDFSQSVEIISPFSIKGVNLALLTFFFYCGTEASMGVWGSSYLVTIKNMDPSLAAGWVSTFFGGITIGRFLTGFITMKMNNTVLIRAGQAVILAGALLIVLPLPLIFSLAGFTLIGLGCAPIFPCMLHETPARFGRENSQTVIGYQMAFAYIGATFLPPVLGWISAKSTLIIFPFFILAFSISMLICSERLNNFFKNTRLNVFDIKD